MRISAVLLPTVIFLTYNLLVLPAHTDAAPSGDGLKKYKKEEENSSEKFLHNVEDYIVNFMLYTREHPDNFYLLQVKNKLSISRSNLDPNKDTKIVIHGWKNAYNTNSSVVLKNAYLSRYDANVLVVDWSVQSHQNYIASRMDVGKVADVVAQMIDMLVSEFGVESSSIHMVGHSLGAHVAGIAGLRLQTGNISRITGLDPAAPMFTVHESSRLRSDSADFVDVIHTCGDVLGFKAALGQADFFPNGGTYEQPGCGFDYKGKCSHARSYKYFAESIQSNDFYAVPCSDWDTFKEDKCHQPAIPMGEYTPSWARGSYYLRTNDEAPFGRGQNLY